jgi:hypothetical protein
MTESRKTNRPDKLDEEFASTSNDDRATANDENSKGTTPQGGKGTPSQAEGDDVGEDE